MEMFIWYAVVTKTMKYNRGKNICGFSLTNIPIKKVYAIAWSVKGDNAEERLSKILRKFHEHF